MKDSDAPFSAINKTGNETAKMGEGDVAGAGSFKVNLPNPYGPSPMADSGTKGGGKSSSHETY